METISNATVTKCQRCGEWTNYADDAHYKVREAEKERLRGLCSWAAGRLLDAGDVEGHEKVLAALRALRARVAELTEERELVGRMYDTQAKRVAELEAAHRNILVHTARLPDAKPRLLHGLLDSCERIARAALAGKEGE